MYVVSANKSSKKHDASRPGVGSYVSQFVDVRYAEDYVSEEAIRIEYQLKDEHGNAYRFSEVFHNTTRNARTVQFFEYLEEHGITYDEKTGLPNLVGLKEAVELRKKVGYKWPVIVQREFICDEVRTDDLQDR